MSSSAATLPATPATAPATGPVPTSLPVEQPPVVIAHARGRSVSCEHDWQKWGADSRYRLCRKCKRAERLGVGGEATS